MKLIIKKELLLKGVNVVERNVGKNLSLPVLSNILLKTEGDNIKLISTDLETAVTVKLPGKIEKQGSILVSPRILSGFLNNLPEGNLELETKDNSLQLKQGDYSSLIKGEEDKDFPIIPKVNKKKYFSIKTQELTEGLNQVVNSVALSDLKPELTGVFFSVADEELTLVSTDSFRLSEKKISNIKTDLKEEQFILPIKTAQEMIRCWQDNQEEANFYIDENQVLIESGGTVSFVSKLVEGDFPAYTQIIPKEFKTKYILNKDSFIKQVRAASLFSSRINDIKLEFKDGKVNIETENYDVGNYNSSVDASGEGEETKIVFNHQYLLDGLSNVRGDEVMFKLNNEDNPTLLESTENKDYIYIIMPIRN